jgi:hypothetical protein
MAASAEEDPNDMETPPDTTMENDDVTVQTETINPKIDYIGDEMTEYTLRYEIPYNKGQANKNDFKKHVTLLTTLTKAFDKTELRIVDNKNKRVKSFEEAKWKDREYYNSHFKVNLDENQRKTVIVHRIRSKEPISGIKGESTVLTFLKTSNTFLRAHFWKEDETLLKDIGFVIRYVPTHHTKEFVIRDMHERLDFADEDWVSTKPKPPPFRLIHSQPRIKLKDKVLKTHAYSIQVLEQDSAKMSHYLRKLYSDEPFFIPYSTKKKHPEIVARAIVQQNKQMAETYVIVVVGINREIMEAIGHDLQAIDGFIETSETNKTDQQGRWNLLVKAKQFKEVRKNITTNLKTWISNVPERLHDTIPAHFPPPQVNQKWNDTDDDSSAGHASYMSSCAQSYGSFNENDEETKQYMTPSMVSNSRSYAAVLQTRMDIPMVTEVRVPDPTSMRLIAELQAEITRLKQQQGIHTPSTVTATSTPDTTTTERLDQVENRIQDVHKWMNEMVQMMRDAKIETPADRQQQNNQGTKHSTEIESPQRHQSKRTDTRATPERPGNPPQTSQERTNEGSGQGNNYGQGQMIGYGTNPYQAYPPIGYNPGIPYPPRHLSPPNYQQQPYQHQPPYYTQPQLTHEPMQDTAVGTSESLPAEGARTYHA